MMLRKVELNYLSILSQSPLWDSDLDLMSTVRTLKSSLPTVPPVILNISCSPPLHLVCPSHQYSGRKQRQVFWRSAGGLHLIFFHYFPPHLMWCLCVTTVMTLYQIQTNEPVQNSFHRFFSPLSVGRCLSGEFDVWLGLVEDQEVLQLW